MDKNCLNKWCDCGSLATQRHGAKRVCDLCLMGIRQDAKRKRKARKERKA